MDYRTTAGDQRHEVRRFTQFANDRLDAGQLEVDRSTTCSDDLVTTLRQRAHQMPTDEAARAQNENVIIHAKFPRAAFDRS